MRNADLPYLCGGRPAKCRRPYVSSSVGLSCNVLRKQTMGMLLTGEFIDAQTACEGGFVNHVVPADQLDPQVGRLVANILVKPAMAMGKQLFYR